jgi:phage/plasmid-associated DNA primase
MSCGGYFGTFNAGCLAYKETSNDEAQQLRWLMLLQTKRIIISNEIKVNHKLDANAIKKMSSGGKDKIVARGHGGNECEYPYTALAIANMNDACEVAPKDDALNNRVKSFTYNKPYVPVVTDETCELLADPNVDTEVLTPEFRVKFMNLLIADYLEFLKSGEIDEPDEVIESKEMWFGISKDSIINSVLEDFEFTGLENDYVKSKDFKNWIKDRDLKITDTKLGIELKKYIAKNNLTGKVYNKGKKIGGKTYVCWFGMKLIYETDEC